MAKHQPCSRLPLLGLLFFKALLRFEACWETKLLCHTTTCASSVWFPLALQSVKGGEGDFFFSSSLVHSSQQLPYPSLLSLAVTQQRLCRQPTQPGWKNPKADCCVNISHQGNMKCSVIFIHGIVESFCATVTKQYLTCQLWGEDGLGRLFWLRGTTGSREWNSAAGWGEVWSSFSSLVKQVSGSRLDAPEGNTEFLQGCKTEGWELNF